jgi:hypothetical protein
MFLRRCVLNFASQARVESFPWKLNMIQLLAWNVPQHLLLITFCIAGSRIMMNTNLKLFLSRFLVTNYICNLQIKLQFSKRNKQTPLLPLPESNSIHVTTPDQGLSSKRGKSLGTRLLGAESVFMLPQITPNQPYERAGGVLCELIDVISGQFDN